MTTIKKRFLILIVALLSLLSIVFGTAFFSTNTSAAGKAEEITGKKYYYEHLTIKDKNGNKSQYTLAKKFYEILEKINQAGDFRKGKVSYELSDVLTSNQIKSWVRDGQLDVPKAFSAARDSFLMDHPELFYVDMYKLTISAAYTGGVYSAYIDTGREANVYRDKTFKTEQQVNNAIVTFNNKVEEIANTAIENADKDTSNSNRDVKLAKAVNEQIAENVYYDFNTLNNATSGQNVLISNMTFSSYGALVYNKAVCSGYSSAYKVIMDYLNIPCIMVSGYSKGKDKYGADTESDVGHSWNYVWLETAEKNSASNARTGEVKGEWFAFDTTWNSLSANVQKYSAMNAFEESRAHVSYGVISSSGYELTYPALSSLTYVEATNPDMLDRDIEDEGFSYNIKALGSDNYNVVETINYNGKNATELLAQDGLRLVTRSKIMRNGEKQWSKWQDVVNSMPNEGSGIEDKENGTTFYLNNNIYQTQYAIVEGLEPDTDAVDGAITWEKIFFGDVDQLEKHMVYTSQIFTNPAYGTYTAAPYINNTKTTPYEGGIIIINDSMAASSSSAVMADKNAINFKIVYDEPLHILDKSKPIGIDFTSKFDNIKNYAGFVKFSDGKYVHLTADENGVMNTLEFKFKPSLMYEHDRSGYAFDFSNVGSAKIVDKNVNGQLIQTTSDKLPNHAYFVFARLYLACPRVFGDGRLWVDCCAQPTLVDNSDLSAMNFKDKDDNSTFSDSSRSQMMLVVDKVSKETENTMLNEISEENSINLNKNDIKSSQTYDINLQICGKFPTIPDGSYVKIALGFPEGYGPKDEGVTFKLFHRKHLGGDNYVIEEVPCVVTKFGIVATVTSFSPYMVAVVDSNKVTDKTIYASIDGKGGKLTLEDGKIRTVEEGTSYTYTLNPEEGYKLHNVSLNGKDVTDRVVDGKLTVSYDEMNHNNELTIKYIAEEVVERYESNNIIEPVKVVVSTEGNTEKYDYNNDGLHGNKVDTRTIIIIAASIVTVIAAAGVIILIRKKTTTK